MPNGPCQLSPSVIVDVAQKLAQYAVAGNINPTAVLMQLELSPGFLNIQTAPNELWLQITQAIHAGRSQTAGFRSDAVGRLVNVVAQGLQGNDELNQLAYSLCSQSPALQAGLPAIFLSYATPDRPSVDALFTAIQTVDPKVSIFQDYRSIALGKDWLDEIHTAAGSTSIMACWLTRNYLKSAATLRH
jgi:hypothetical protein